MPDTTDKKVASGEKIAMPHFRRPAKNEREVPPRKDYTACIVKKMSKMVYGMSRSSLRDAKKSVSEIIARVLIRS